MKTLFQNNGIGNYFHIISIPILFFIYILYNDSFIYRSLFFYYLLIIITYSSIIHIFLISLFQKKQIVIGNFNSIFISILIIIYPIINYKLTKQTEWYYFTYFISVFILYISLSISFSNNYLNYTKIKQILVIVGIIETMICITQFTNFIESGNHFFKVTGSNSNPNVTAMFLTMLLPILINYLQKANKLISKFAIVLIIAVQIFVIIILKSRTAYIGTIVIFGIYLISTIKKFKVNKLLIYIFIGIGFITSVVVIQQLYEFKKNSADGRILIWKITTQIVYDKPITGYGYGMTQHAYNLAQAKYFKTNKSNDIEKQNAGYVSNLLNEYLEQFVQGGIFGGLLYTSFIVYIFFISFRQRKENLYLFAGILAFILMSFFNIAFYSPQTVITFMVYAAILYKNQKNENQIYLKNHNLFISMIIVSSTIVITTIIQANSQKKLKEVQDLILNKKIDEAQYIIETKIKNISTSEIYYSLNGDILAIKQYYVKAINNYDKAFMYVPSSEIAIKIAFCQYQKKNFIKAIKYLNYANNHQPNLFEPYFGLMTIYNEIGDIKKSKEIAQTIVDKEVKINSERIQYFKTTAKKILNEH